MPNAAPRWGGGNGRQVCGLAASYLLIYANNHVRKRLVER